VSVKCPDDLGGHRFISLAFSFGADTLLLFVLVIFEARNSAEKVILGILFLPLFFYMLFCISGRGVDILSQTVKTGIKSIDITWHGIKIEFGPKDLNEAK
jgi:hypothetical protein